jgi:branched-chain amino acid transport system substrate-binding protein
MRSRNLTSLAAALAAVALAAGCGSDSDSGGGDAGEDAKEPVKVAMVPPTSGPLALFGEQLREGGEFAIKQLNAEGGIDGRKLELLVGETDGKPESTLRTVERFVQREDVSFVTGIMTSSESAALQEKLPALGATFINVISRDDALTGETCSPRAFRVAASNSMLVNTAASQIGNAGVKKWAIIAPDYSFGRDAAESLKEAVKNSGGTVVKEVYPPLGTTEYGSYITQLARSGAEGLIPVLTGGDLVAFVNQADQFKLLRKIKAVQGVISVQTPILEPLGKRAIGFRDTLDYHPGIDTEKNQEFVKAWEAEHGEPPTFVHANVWLAFETLAAAIEKAGSADSDEVNKALEGLSYDTIFGQVTMRAEDHQLLRDTYAAEVVEGDLVAGMDWKILETIPPDVGTPEPDPACEL